MTHGVFSDLKVIDLASFIAGPASTVILGDFGADVIKVEPPEGDPYRGLASMPGMPDTALPFHHLVDNRNKRSITLDLNTAEARAVLYKMVETVDVVVSNHRPSLREKLGTRYEDFKAVNEQVIFATITGYGERGEEANKAGFDSTALWARTGLMDLVKPYPSAEPARSLPGMGDHPTAVSLYAAIVTALYQRERTGKGSHVSTTLVANGLWSNAYYGQAALLGAEVLPRPPRAEVKNALTHHYQCSDGRWFILSMVSEDREWERFCDAIEQSQFREDPRFKSKADRHQNPLDLAAELDRIFGTQPWLYWRDRLEAHRITFGPVARVSDLTSDRQLQDGGALVPLEMREADGELTIDSPLWIEGSKKRPPQSMPDIGEHTVEILEQFGYSADDIKDLKDNGALG